MAVDKKISQLASGAPAQAGDEYVVARSGANYKLTLTNIAASMPPIGATTPNTGSFTSLTNSGNLTFSSTGQRITGDFGNATPSNRVMFQNSVTNANTQVEVIPNGTATVSGIVLSNNSDPNNCSNFFVGTVGTTDCRLSGNSRGTGTLLPMTFYTGGSERMRLDTSGLLGLGTSSPSSFESANGSSNLVVGSGSGAEGITIYSGNAANNYGAINFADGTTGDATYRGIVGYRQDIDAMLLYTAATERMRIDSSGNVGIGGAAAAFTKVDLVGTLSSSSNFSEGYRVAATIPSGTTNVASMFVTYPTTQAASFTLGTLAHFRAIQNTLGAGSAITTQYGFLAESSLTGATNNFGFYSNIASGSNRWNFYAAGTAANYFAGRVLVGGTAAIGDGINNFSALMYTRNTSATAGKYWSGPYVDNNNTFYILNQNNVGVYITDGATTWTANSDERMKTDLKPIDNAAAKVSTLRAVTGRFKTDAEGISRSFLIAQDVLAVLPEAVDASNPEKLGVAYTDVIPLLVAAIKELSAKVAVLEAK